MLLKNILYHVNDFDKEYIHKLKIHDISYKLFEKTSLIAISGSLIRTWNQENFSTNNVIAYELQESVTPISEIPA